MTTTTASGDPGSLHAEIDNPLDMIAGHQLLAEGEERPGGQLPYRRSWVASCDCGHPACPAPGVHRRTPVTRVFVAERHPVASAGLRAVLGSDPGITVVGSSGDPLRLLDALRRVKPDVVLLGAGGALAEDLALVARLRAVELVPEVRVLLLRRAETTAEASRMLLAGASGCFPLDLPEDRIIRAVGIAGAGGWVFLPAPPPAGAQAAIPSRYVTEPLPQHCGLTDRERQVLTQLARGLSNAEIGRELALAEATVKKHLTHAMRKIGQSDRLRAALYAHRHGLG
ncbi:response regulator transcription factor [Streptomyces sp. NA04227]|uniref:response regulator transcription factor n=1 Tax=Streptomyces sp. NA04227 TaxID=2742136 RepID=UPI00158FD7FB|nr:response regulator transcription factor [Streptomyces sp. NA04227]QKW05906.1 response regulator transcription factor [Streptomyces sp. NA04227]